MSTASPDPSLDGESKSEWMIAMTVAFTILSTSVVAARIYTRAYMLRNLGSDDFLIGITQVLVIGLNTVTIIDACFGVGRHSWLVSPEDAVHQLQGLFASIQLYIWSLCFVKISLLIQYRRIFPPRWLQNTALGIIGGACVLNLAQSILVVFTCLPSSVLFPSMADSCLDSLTVWYIAAALNIASDFVVWLLPIPLIHTLRLNPRQKVLLYMVFGLGLFACAVSLVRATTLHRIAASRDPSWDGAAAATWSMLEVNCAVLCSCLPTVRFLLARLAPWLGLLRTAASAGAPYHASRSPIVATVSGGGDAAGRRREASCVAVAAAAVAAAAEEEEQAEKQQQQQQPPGGARPKLILDTESPWGDPRVHRGPAPYLHGHLVSAWVSARPSPVDSSPSKARRNRGGSATRTTMNSEDEGKASSPFSPLGGSEPHLGQQILVTRTTTVEEDRREAPIELTPANSS